MLEATINDAEDNDVIDKKGKEHTHIIGEAKHDFRRTVPSCRDVLRHEPLVSGTLARTATRSEAKYDVNLVSRVQIYH